MATEKQILANRRSRRAPGRARWRARRAPRMNARRHGLASLLEGVMPETSMDVEAPAERLSEIESEGLRLCQAIEQGLKQGTISRLHHCCSAWLPLSATRTALLI